MNVQNYLNVLVKKISTSSEFYKYYEHYMFLYLDNFIEEDIEEIYNFIKECYEDVEEISEIIFFYERSEKIRKILK